MNVHVRQSGSATEMYLTAQPRLAAEADQQAQGLLNAILAALPNDAAILQERYFGTQSALETMARRRKDSLTGWIDGVEPTWLVTPPNALGPMCGVQIHAVSGCGRPAVLSVAGLPSGRLVEYGASRYLVGCNLQAEKAGPPEGQARAMLAKAEDLLTQAGGGLANVARTWMWLGGILDWYGPFNRVRNEVFAARGLMPTNGTGRLPASTGIGIGPSGGRACTMDFAAVLGEHSPRFLLAASKQGPASKYGSAFSRAAVAQTPGGRTVYVSGTAAIDASGKTTHVGDIRGQIRDTLTNVWSVLADASCGGDDVVQAIAYCKTPQVEQAFREVSGGVVIPHLVAIADVCRDDLLFEVEATAMPHEDIT